MGLQIIRKRERVLHEEYGLFFEYECGSGFSFPCDKDGQITEIGEYAWYNLNKAISDYFDGHADMCIENYSRYYMEPAIGLCVCGEEVYLYRDYGHGIDCKCGRIYNMGGQELAPRSQWEDRYEDDDSVGYNVRFGYVGSDY